MKGCSPVVNSNLLHSYFQQIFTQNAILSLKRPLKYLSSAFTHVADVPSRRRLRSVSTNQLLVPSYRRSTIGRRAFPLLSGTIFHLTLRLLRRWPSLDGAWRQIFFAAATMLQRCLTVSYSY